MVCQSACAIQGARESADAAWRTGPREAGAVGALGVTRRGGATVAMAPVAGKLASGLRAEFLVDTVEAESRTSCMHGSPAMFASFGKLVQIVCHRGVTIQSVCVQSSMCAWERSGRVTGAARNIFFRDIMQVVSPGNLA